MSDIRSADVAPRPKKEHKATTARQVTSELQSSRVKGLPHICTKISAGGLPPPGMRFLPPVNEATMQQRVDNCDHVDNTPTLLASRREYNLALTNIFQCWVNRSTLTEVCTGAQKQKHGEQSCQASYHNSDTYMNWRHWIYGRASSHIHKDGSSIEVPRVEYSGKMRTASEWKFFTLRNRGTQNKPLTTDDARGVPNFG